MHFVLTVVPTQSFCVLSLQPSSGAPRCSGGARRTDRKKYLTDEIKAASATLDATDFTNDRVASAIEPFLSKSRQLRANVLDDNERRGFMSLSRVHALLGPLAREHTQQYSVHEFPFRAVFTAALFGGGSILREDMDLSQLHAAVHADLGMKGLRDEKLRLLSPLLDGDRRRPFHELYDNFVRRFILPGLHAELPRDGCGGDDTFYYQSFPCVRVVRPGEFSIGIHADCNYGHHPGNINFYLPLVRICGNNSLVLESYPGAEDWHALDLTYGDLHRFHGSVCNHFTPENTTSSSRISFDFRIIPGRAFEADHDQYSSKPGYYVKCTKNLAGEWLRDNHDDGLHSVVDWRCGFPFTDC